MRATGILIFVLILAAAIPLSAQTLKVINETTLQPIENVYVYNNAKNRTAVTNAKGEIDLSKFSRSDTLFFQHPSYKRKVRTFQQVEARDYLVKMVERSIKMEEVYVSASKRMEDQSQIPQKITQVNTEQIRFSNSQTSADLLQNTGKVFVQKSQLGGGSPMIRGFAANSVLIAVDGVRMNNAIFRSGNLQNVISVDANVLEQTEVIYGPGSIIYGSDALGGVMNFQTKEPELSFSENSVYTRMNSLARYSSANNEQTYHVDLNYGREKWGLVTSLTYSNYDDLRSGEDFYDSYPDFGKREEFIIRENGTDIVMQNDDVTIQKFSGYEQLFLMQKIRYKPSGDWDLNYGLHFSTSSDIPRYDRLIERENGDTGPLLNSEWYYGPQIWMMHVLDIQSFNASPFYDKISGTFTYQWFQESRNDRKFQRTELRNREENVDVVTANIDFDKFWGDKSKLFYGLEGVYNYVSSDARETNLTTGQTAPEATRYPDGGSDYTQMAVYAKYKHNLSGNLTGVAGMRYSHVMLDSRFDSKQFFDFPFDRIELNTGAFSGSLGLTYRPAKNLQFNLKGSSGFRAPNVDDVAKVFDSEPGKVIVPNDNLKPEHAYNLDFAVIKKFDGWARIELNTFYTWLRDAMVRRNFQFNGQDSLLYDGAMSRVQAVVNAGKAYIYGASAGLSVELSDHFNMESYLTFTEGMDITNDEPLRHVAPLFGRTSLTYKAEKIKIEFYSEYNEQKEFNDLSPSERNKPHLYTEDGSPGWITFNTKASYHINSNIEINAGLENIFDKHYRPYSSGISAPGRNVILAVRAIL
ncbi:MAG: TonB-dependent receptor [Balneolaceae bacterium]|nr:TonB-dependent receptor [Balneolaceae bacterium]